jgi:uncharacterized membrane protein YdfJ with MMPL/SSD domain
VSDVAWVTTTEPILEQRIHGAADLVHLHQDVRRVLPGIKVHVVTSVALAAVMLAGDALRYGALPVTLRIVRSSARPVVRIEVDDHRTTAANAPAPQDYRSHLLDRMTTARGAGRRGAVTRTWADVMLVAGARAS